MPRLRVAFPNLFTNAPENQEYMLMELGFYDVFTRNISDEVDVSQSGISQTVLGIPITAFYFLIPCLLQSVRRHLVTVVSVALETCRRYFQ